MGSKTCAWSALRDPQSVQDSEFLVDLRLVLGAARGKQNPVVNLAVAQYEAHRCPLGYGFFVALGQRAVKGRIA